MNCKNTSCYSSMLAFICVISIICLITYQFINKFELLLVDFILITPNLILCIIKVVMNIDKIIKIYAILIIISNFECRRNISILILLNSFCCSLCKMQVSTTLIDNELCYFILLQRRKIRSYHCIPINC